MKKLLVGALVWAAVLTASAGDFVWNGGTAGEWTNADNWTSEAGGYPNGADDIASFAQGEATSVSVASEVEVKGIAVSGTGTLNLTGSSIMLGANGIKSSSATEDAIITVENALSISAVQTVISNTTAAVHLKGVISGEGGILKGGAARLYLYSANTFTGGFEAMGTRLTPKGTKPKNSGSISNGKYVFSNDPGDSSGVVIYNTQAFGSGDVQFDKGITGDHSTGARLTIMNCSGTFANNLRIANDAEATAPTWSFRALEIYGGDITFTGTITGSYRVDFPVLSANTVHITQKIGHGNYLIFYPSVDGAKIYMDGPMSGTCEFNSLDANSIDNEVHLTAASTSGVNLFAKSCPIILDGENVLPQILPYDFYWECNDAKIDLNGYNQKITSWTEKWKAKLYPSAQITTAEDKPAQIFCTQANNGNFGCRFTGAAGIVWNPSGDKTLFVSNTTSTTCGEIGITNGTVELKANASFTRLGKLAVESGAKLALAADAGTFKVSKLQAATGAIFNLNGGRQIVAGKMTVGGAEVAEGSVLTAETHPDGITLTGTGSIRVTGEGTPNYWKGADGAKWSEKANWSTGEVPDGENDVYITNAVSVTVDAAITKVRAIYLGDGSSASTLLVTNMNSTISANDITLAKKALITCGAAATNAADMSRVHIVCKNLDIAAGGKIDVTKCGWAGGRWELAHDSVSKHAIQNAGYGPGAPGTQGKTGTSEGGFSGASHGGRGGSTFLTWAISRFTYGNAAEPTDAGSGGELAIGYGGTTVGYYMYGAAGGGIVRIEATGNVTVDGEILADGGESGGSRSTAASGGSIWITCSTIVGTGTIRAAGGDGDDPRIPILHYRGQNGNATDTDIRYSPAAGGGRIAIDYDASKQAGVDALGLMVSAAAGEYFGGDSTLATRDNEETAAEPGTLHFTDTTLVKQLFGNGLSGRICGLNNITFEGDLNFTRGFIASMEEGFTMSVSGNLKIIGDEARLEVGGVNLTNLASVATVWGGRTLNKLTVGGDFTIEKGGSFVIRAAETNSTMQWGGEVTVGGAFTIGSNGYAYAACDGKNLAAPKFEVGSMSIDRYGTLSASRRGGLGADMRGISGLLGYTSTTTGFGFGGGTGGVSASHGGLGAKGWVSGQESNGTVAETYDDEWLPTMPGSGGGAITKYGLGGTGGGVVYVVAGGAVQIDGTVSADGWCGNYFYVSGMNVTGAGSGGTVFICGETVAGGEYAKITAAGGSAMQGRTGAGWQATGGGGRIAIWSGASKFLAGKCHKNHHNVKPAAFLGSASAETGELLYPIKGNVVTADAETAAKIMGAAGTVRYGTFEEPCGLTVIVR